MTNFTLCLATAIAAATAGVALENESLAQGGTTPQSQGMGAARSGSAMDSDKGESARPGASKSEFDKGFTGQQSGIGEQNSGQERSTMERSGGKKALTEETVNTSDLSKGKAAQAMDKQLHREQTGKHEKTNKHEKTSKHEKAGK
jgi:hypothetical protein